jgi:hypothetical protein
MSTEPFAHQLEVETPPDWFSPGGTLDPHRCRRGSTTVAVTLTPTASGTLLIPEHGVLCAEDAIGWPHFLSRLSRAAVGLDPGLDPFAQAT